MEVKGQLISSMGLGAPELQGGPESKLQAERIASLQERKQLLEALLNSRVGELRHVCLQEAELTGKLSRGFPLEEGERAPLVQRRVGSKTEDDSGLRKQRHFTGPLYRSTESDRNVLNNKRTMHRGCHTEDAVISESTSSMSDSTSHDNESSPSVAVDQRSLSQPRLSVGSPDQRISRKLSPVEIYYEMRTRRNSVTSSGRSDPAGGSALKWSGSLDVPHMIPLAPEGSSTDHRSCPYSSRARRSNSSEALLDRSSLSEDPPPRNGMPPNRGGPYKSSEALTDGKLRHIHLGSPERNAEGSPADQAKLRLSMGGRAGSGGGAGYNEMLMDYIWGKQQRVQVQPHLYQSTGRIWQDMSSTRSSTANAPPLPPPPPPHANGFSHSQVHLPSAAAPYSPMVMRGSQAENRRVKVTRTKSCGPFIPLQQQDSVLLSAYEAPHPVSGASTSSNPNLYPYQTELLGPALSRRAPQFSLPTPEDSTRSLHKALALEGLRDWYLRNALGYPATAAVPKGHEAGVSRLSHPHPLAHQGQAVQGEPLSHQRSQMTQSASFHGHPLHGRTVEFSLYQEPPQPQMQEVAPKEPNADPGTLV
ncbi:unnamed protein product [Boreogadus saida]